MFVGVVGFYFLLSDINAIISEAVNKEMQFSSKLSMLEKVNESYKLSQETYKEAKISLYQLADSSCVDLPFFYRQFPLKIREELKYAVYNDMLVQFPLFHKLKMEQINRIGDALKFQVFEKSNLSF
jgi:hypothetical protein